MRRAAAYQLCHSGQISTLLCLTLLFWEMGVIAPTWPTSWDFDEVWRCMDQVDINKVIGHWGVAQGPP